ncbi:MAG: hypothetical protein GYA55_14515, partial [SAR324 cluster bacterium]|nr:hypothetical protein [SAR324 cluster bacterium]
SSIANPKVRYRLFLNGKEVLNLPPRDSSLDRAAAFFKGSTLSFQRSYPVCSEKGESLPDMLMEIEGIIGHPSLAQRETAAFVLFVNNRMISDKALLRAVKDGFDSTLKEREYPIGYLHIRMPPALVDVNVHPQKSEVRFWDQRILFGLVRDVVYQTVRNFKAPMEGMASLARKSGNIPEPAKMISDFRSESSEVQALFAGVPKQAGKNIEQFKLSQLRYVGQIFDCYLLCESTDQFVIVDMHAAHERLNFNILKRGALAGNNNSQMLLLPHTVNLSEESQARLLNQTELLASFGFEFEAFGPGTVIVRAVPQMLDSVGAETVLKEVAATEFEEEGQGVLKANIDEIAARIACHASVRSGVQLEREEVYFLFESLDSEEFSSACPHGRPVVASFSKMDVEKWFGRDR